MQGDARQRGRGEGSDGCRLYGWEAESSTARQGVHVCHTGTASRGGRPRTPTHIEALTVADAELWQTPAWVNFTEEWTWWAAGSWRWMAREQANGGPVTPPKMSR
jgi:hypothetical protein